VTGVHVSVRLGDEIYALPVDNVLEVTGPGAVSALPASGDHVLGVRNLRGTVVPVFDLAALVGAAGAHAADRVCVTSRAGRLAGFAVDEVVDVGELPAAGDDAASPLLAGSMLVDGQLIGVVDVDRLFAELERRGGR
jgi:purine-binding chemotaxis protein CheW